MKFEFNALTAFGLTFQACFMARFIVQWIASERAGKSVVPLAFWILSIVGACGLFTYAIIRGDLVFAIGQSTGIFIYLRNLVLIRKTHLKEKAEREAGDSPPKEGDES